MNFNDFELLKPEEWWWEHESIDTAIFTKMDLSLFSFKATIYVIYESCRLLIYSCGKGYLWDKIIW